MGLLCRRDMSITGCLGRGLGFWLERPGKRWQDGNCHRSGAGVRENRGAGKHIPRVWRNMRWGWIDAANEEASHGWLVTEVVAFNFVCSDFSEIELPCGVLARARAGWAHSPLLIVSGGGTDGRRMVPRSM